MIETVGAQITGGTLSASVAGAWFMQVRHRRFIAGLLAALAIPVVSALDFGTLPLDPPQVTPSASVSSYLHDVSQPIPGVSWMTSITEHHRITMADGVELDAWIVRPDIPGQVPLVLELTPYYGGGDPTVTKPVSNTANYPHNIAIAGPFQELIKRQVA